MALAWLCTACYSGLDHGGGGPLAGGDDGVSGVDDGDGAGDGAGDDAGDNPDGDDGGAAALGADEPLRRLTQSQFRNTIQDLIGYEPEALSALPPDEKAGAFFSNYLSAVGEVEVRNYMKIAETIADELVVDPDVMLGCELASDGCAEGFIENFATRAYRRPLADEELTALTAIYGSSDERPFGLKLAVSAILQSPNFLYHVERGDGGPDEHVRLTDYELASRVSYFLWDSMPDEALFDAAAAGLDTAALTQQVERMLDEPRARVAIGGFHRQWLGLERLQPGGKDPDLFPMFDEALVDAMLRETEEFATSVILDDGGSLKTLLTASYTFADGALLALYGEDATAGGPGEPVMLDPSRRAGILTQPAFLAAHAHRDQTSPVPRGVTIRRNLFCDPPALPPPTVGDTLPAVDPNATAREQLEQHRSDPTCSACHESFDGLGFGFEHYDAIGAYRTAYGGSEVDASGWVDGYDDTFDGAIELANRLADDPAVRNCMVKQWFRYSRGRVETPDDKTTFDKLNTAFSDSDGNVRDLIVQIAVSEAFATRGPVRQVGE